MARILVIDDEEMVRQTYRMTLELSGHEVVEAASGDEGIEKYRQDPADLVVTDIKMEPKGGLAVIRELKADHPDVKVIAITGYDPSALDEAMDQGAVRVFTKPLKMSELTDAIAELLGGDA
jgi:DNA-binding NtrC family response regulator